MAPVPGDQPSPDKPVRATGTPVAGGSPAAGRASAEGSTRRTGRRPGSSGSRQAILDAARGQFAERGYDGATIRGIAREAKVDPALVHHFFLSKEGVFSAAMQEAFNLSEHLPQVWEPGREGSGERLVRMFLALWDSQSTRNPMLGMIRSAVSHEESANLLREFVTREIFGQISSVVPAERASTRAALIGSQLIGLAMMRYVVRIEPLSGMEPSEIARWIGPTLQRYLYEDVDSLPAEASIP